MSDERNDDRDTDLSGRPDDAAHPFDQTNDLVDGLEGDADSPEQVDKRAGTGDGAEFLAAPAPGAHIVGGIVPAVAERRPDDDGDAGADPDADDPTPA